MRRTGDQESARGATVRSRLLSGLLGAALTLVAFAVAAVEIHEVSVRMRVDTPVQAVTVGEPGCITAAAFVGPDGQQRLVDLRRYKSNCIDGQPGDRVTVYYAADDPAVYARTQQWWGPALLALLPLALGCLGVLSVVRAVRGHSQPRALRTPSAQRNSRRVGDDRPPSTSSASPTATPTPTAQLYREDEKAHLVHDHAIQRLELLLADVRAELALPLEARTSTQHDAGLVAVHARLEAVRRALLAGALPAAEEDYAVIARLVGDEWRTDSPLAERLLAFRRTLLRG